MLSAQHVADLINDGQNIVIYEGYALDLDNWLHKHPGGVLPIRHMVGRDGKTRHKRCHTRALLAGTICEGAIIC